MNFKFFIIKKIFIIVFFVGIVLSIPLFSKNINISEKNKLQIVTSSPLVKNIVEKIGKDKVKVVSIIQNTSCSHEHELSANDLKQAANCSVFVKIGMGADKWADKLIANIENKKRIIIDSSQNIRSVKIYGFENPHYWWDIDNVKIMAENIFNGLVKADPTAQIYFRNNFNDFIQELDKTASELKNEISKLQNKKIVSYTNAFPYLYKYFGLQNLMTVELSCEQEVSPKTIVDAVKLMRNEKIKIIIGNASEPKEAEGLATETQSKILLLWTMTDESGDYIKTLRRNIKMLVDALK